VVKKNLTPKQQLALEKRRAEAERHQAEFRLHLLAHECTGWYEEFQFHPNRKFRFDFAYPPSKIAVEIDGGIHMDKGGHNTGTAILRDRRKDQEALLLGWRVYRVVPEMIKSGEAIETIKKLIIQGQLS